MPRPLQIAIFLWKRDLSIPLYLEAALMVLGYDVPALEAHYRA